MALTEDATIDFSTSVGYTLDTDTEITGGVGRLDLNWPGGSGIIRTPNLTTSTWGPIHQVRSASYAEHEDYFHRVLVSFDNEATWVTWAVTGGWRQTALVNAGVIGIPLVLLSTIREWPPSASFTQIKFAVAMTSANTSGDFFTDTKRGNISDIAVGYMAKGNIVDNTYVGTGNGAISAQAAFEAQREETISLTATTTGPSATFTVEGDKSGTQPYPDYTSGSGTYAGAPTLIEFALSDGGTPYAIGDKFTFGIERDLITQTLDDEPAASGDDLVTDQRPPERRMKRELLTGEAIFRTRAGYSQAVRRWAITRNDLVAPFDGLSTTERDSLLTYIYAHQDSSFTYQIESEAAARDWVFGEPEIIQSGPAAWTIEVPMFETVPAA